MAGLSTIKITIQNCLTASVNFCNLTLTFYTRLKSDVRFQELKKKGSKLVALKFLVNWLLNILLKGKRIKALHDETVNNIFFTPI